MKFLTYGSWMYLIKIVEEVNEINPLQQYHLY